MNTTNKTSTTVAKSTDDTVKTFTGLAEVIKEVQAAQTVKKPKYKVGDTVVRFNNKDCQVVEVRSQTDEVHLKNLGIPFDSIWVNAADITSAE